LNAHNRPGTPKKAALVAVVAALYTVLFGFTLTTSRQPAFAKPAPSAPAADSTKVITPAKTGSQKASSKDVASEQSSANGLNKPHEASDAVPSGQSNEQVHSGEPKDGSPSGESKDDVNSADLNKPTPDTAGGDTVFGGSSIDEEMVIGKVLTITRPKINQELYAHTGMVSEHQMVRVKVLEGELKGKEFVIPHELTDNPAFNVAVSPGQEVVLAVVPNKDGKIEVSICDYHRAPVLYWLLAIFLVAFLALGGKKGFKSLVGLLATVLLIGYILLPMSLKGYNPLYTAVGICLLAGTTSIMLIGGFSKKSLSAIIGTVGGVIVAGLAAHIVIELCPLNGLSSEEAQILRGSVLVQQMPFYSGLLAAGMLIGALGVIMDVAISIASSIAEVAKTDTKLTTKQLYDSGMNVGRDIMGTMTNTLILAYAGSALPLLLLATQMPTIKLLNLDLFATEVASALSGSLGLTLTIPLTALAAAKLMSEKQK